MTKMKEKIGTVNMYRLVYGSNQEVYDTQKYALKIRYSLRNKRFRRAIRRFEALFGF